VKTWEGHSYKWSLEAAAEAGEADMPLIHGVPAPAPAPAPASPPAPVSRRVAKPAADAPAADAPVADAPADTTK
jgi:hypothetical protein